MVSSPIFLLSKVTESPDAYYMPFVICAQESSKENCIVHCSLCSSASYIFFSALSCMCQVPCIFFILSRFTYWPAVKVSETCISQVYQRVAPPLTIPTDAFTNEECSFALVVLLELLLSKRKYENEVACLFTTVT